MRVQRDVYTDTSKDRSNREERRYMCEGRVDRREDSNRDGCAKEELQEDNNLLPPWIKFPQIPRYSIGWRMGYGESYMWAWDEWSNRFSKEQLVEYFKKNFPIPIEWLDWVANHMGFEILPADESESSKNDVYTGVKWLEKQGLADFSKFEKWYKSKREE